MTSDQSTRIRAARGGIGQAIFAAGADQAHEVSVYAHPDDTVPSFMMRWTPAAFDGAYLGRCKNCKGGVRVEPAARFNNSPAALCRNPDCRRVVNVKRIEGTFAEGKVCNARCMAATGPACSCRCAGENHGGRFA